MGHRRSCAGGMPFELLAELCAHDAEVRCVDIGGGDSIAVSGGADGMHCAKKTLCVLY